MWTSYWSPGGSARRPCGAYAHTQHDDMRPLRAYIYGPMTIRCKTKNSITQPNLISIQIIWASPHECRFAMKVVFQLNQCAHIYIYIYISLSFWRQQPSVLSRSICTVTHSLTYSLGHSLVRDTTSWGVCMLPHRLALPSRLEFLPGPFLTYHPLPFESMAVSAGVGAAVGPHGGASFETRSYNNNNNNINNNNINNNKIHKS